MSFGRYNPFGFDPFFENDPFFSSIFVPVTIRRENSRNNNSSSDDNGKKQEQEQITRNSRGNGNGNGNGVYNNPLWKHPGWEIHEDDKAYSVSIDVPGVKKDDMTMQVEDNGRTLHLSGSRKRKSSSSSKDENQEIHFSKRFTIGENVDIVQLSAHLENGVLTVTAPKKVPEDNTARRTIPITEGPVSQMTE